ncbi:MAG TPA: YdeI/OmpD-associated family protein [Miltoncostaea sp.]|nr:YdeI/OmpD-associated family protein [Miltoncostaea sp.]
MSPEDAIHFPTAAEWRAWLEEHHQTAPEVWVLTHKKHTGVPSVAWADAVVEALCFGWIDGLVRRVDEDRFVQRWTPRRPTSKWSKVNVATAERLIAEGRMTPAGLETVRIAKERGAWEKAYSALKALRPQPELRAALKTDPAAKARWERTSTTWTNRIVEWIGAAGSEEEAAARIAATVTALREGTRPDMG